MCVLDVHVGQTDVPTGSPGDDPWRNLLPSPMSPGDGGVSLSLLVLLMGKSSRRTDAPTVSPGDDPRRNLLPSPMSPGDGECRCPSWSL